MTAGEVKASLGAAARRAWPKAAKASDLPFPNYWKDATDWLCFHAPHVGDRLMREYIAEVVRTAVLAEATGTEPVPYRVPKKVREIWEAVDRQPEGPVRRTAAEGKHAIDMARGGRADGVPRRAETRFLAPMSGPTPRALKRARREIEQGRLGSW